MYRARKSMHIRNRYPINGIGTSVSSESGAQAQSTPSQPTMQQGTYRKATNIIHQANRMSSMGATFDGRAWFNPTSTKFLCPNVVENMQKNPRLQIGSTCSSTIPKPQVPNEYKLINVDNMRIMGFNKYDKNIRSDSEQGTPFDKFKDSIVSQSPFELPRPVNIPMHQKSSKIVFPNCGRVDLPETIRRKTFTAIHPNRKIFLSELMNACNKNSPQEGINERNNRHSTQNGISDDLEATGWTKTTYCSQTEKPSKYVFDTANPLAFQPHTLPYTFGDFEDIEMPSKVAKPIRNPRDPPCERKSSSLTSIKESEQKAVVGDNTKLSLEERLKQQIITMKDGQLSVNQLYILDLVEDLLEQHEAYANDRTISRRVGFLDNYAKNKQLAKCLANDKLLRVIPLNTRFKSSAQQMDSLELVNSSSNVGKTNKKKKRKKKTALSFTELPTDNCKIKVEVELELNQRLYELCEAKPKASERNDARQSISFMKDHDVRVIDSKLYDKLVVETKNSECESNKLNQITDDDTVKDDKIFKASSPLATSESSKDPVKRMDESPCAHRSFLNESNEQQRQRTKNYSIPQGTTMAKEYEKDNKLDIAEAPSTSKSKVALDRSKNRKKKAKKQGQRR